jgi:hypothetical protein
VIGRLRAFVHRLVGAYLKAPGDGRRAPAIPAATLLRSLLAGYLLREGAFHAVEALVRSGARLGLGVRHPFGDDTLASFTERLAIPPLRTALAQLIRAVKRRKAFDDVWRIGVVLDGTTVGRCPTVRCPACQPILVPHRDVAGQPTPFASVVGQQHKLSLLAVVVGAVHLPVDLEPYGPGDSELAASLRLLDRGVAALGPRFTQYVLGDGLYANVPFLHAAGDHGLRALVRLEGNLPTLFAAAQARFEGTPPRAIFEDQGDRVEVWDADDFDPWEDLRWPTVRVFRYRQTHPDGTVIHAYWLTDFSARQVIGQTLYRLAKGRWTIENQGFNDGKSQYGLDDVPHHEANSLLIHCFLVLLTLTLERLSRLRYLHRGTHAPISAITLIRRLRLSLGQPVVDSS